MPAGVSKEERILSIDVLRGFDMLMIIFADRFFYHLHEGAQLPWTGFLALQFEHPEWLGFHFYDIIMPLFLFLVGAVIPYSISARVQQQTGRKRLYRRIFRRVLILFVLGWIVQGNLLAWDLDQFKIFSNTLQAIAVGYLFSALAYIHLKPKDQYILFAACLIVYALVQAFLPVPGSGRSILEPDKNFAIYFDRLVFGRFDDGLQYTWLLSGLGFTATTLSGLFAGELIKSDRSRKQVALLLLLIGLSSFAVGLIWGIWHPIVKKIWSSSFVLFSSGLCFMLLSGFYWLIDVKRIRGWIFPLRVIGMNAITAYVLSHVIDFSEIANFLLFGTEQFLGSYYEAVSILGGAAILYWLLWYMYRNGSFVKV